MTNSCTLTKADLSEWYDKDEEPHHEDFLEDFDPVISEKLKKIALSHGIEINKGDTIIIVLGSGGRKKFVYDGEILVSQ